MKDSYVNRLNMFRATLTALDAPAAQAVWLNQPPTIFTTKVNEARALVDGLEQLAQDQERVRTGVAADKAREENELEQAAHRLSRLLATYYTDKGNLTAAQQIDLTLSQWRRLRDEQLLAKARQARDLAQAALSDPAATTYGITPAAVAALTKEADDYEAIIGAPSATIAERKALTGSLRDRFNQVEAKFEELDDLILAFDATPAGRALIATYRAARIIRDAGRGPATGPSGVTSPAPPAS